MEIFCIECRKLPRPEREQGQYISFGMRCTAKNANNVFFLSLMENETRDSQGLKRGI